MTALEVSAITKLLGRGGEERRGEGRGGEGRESLHDMNKNG